MNVLSRSPLAPSGDNRRGLMHGMGRRWLHACLIVLVLATLLAFVHPPRAHADAVASPDTTLNSLWNTYGNAGGHWTGGDSTVSVLLPDGRIAWLFSDTFLGTVNSDYSRPTSTPFIHNSMVVQQGSTLTTITGGTASAPTTLVQAVTNSSSDWDWVDYGFVSNNQLEVFYTQYEKTGSSSLSFQQVATAIATFSLPGLSLQSVTQLNVGTSLTWGAAVLVQSDYTYMYGIEGADGNRFLHLARAPSGQVLTAGSNPTAAWQFWTGSSWSASESASARIMSGTAGVSIAQINNQYVLVTQDASPDLPFDPNLVAYTATSPTGPFGNKVYLYQPPEATGGNITYGPELHPELDSSGTLVLSYNVNSLQSGGDYADARIYRPRFLDVTWPVAAPNPATRPAAPTNLSGTSDNLGIHLSWTASTTSGVSYWIYEQDLTAGQTQPTRRPTPVTSGTTLTLTDLTDNDTYQFYVTAYDSGGESAPSNSASAVFTVPAPTTAPTGLTATPNSDGTISLQWKTVAGLDISYNVYDEDVTAGQTSFTLDTSVNDGTSTTVSYLTQDHEYEFEVSAFNPGGEGPRSAPVTAVSHAVPPAAPTGLTAKANNDGTITLSWTASAPNVWYWIYYCDVIQSQSCTYTRTTYPVTTGTTFTLSYLTIGDVYSFYVTAINAGGESPASNSVQATPFMPPPPAPTGLTAKANNNGTITLSWTAPAPNLWYWIYYADVKAGQTTYTKSTYPVTTGTTFTMSYLTLGDLYAFYVTAVNAGGESAHSNTVQATPYLPPPGAPTDLDAAAGNGKVILSWTAPAPGLWYWIYYRDVTQNPNGAYTRTTYPVTSGTSFTLTYLTNGDTYEFYVTAINAGGQGPASNTVEATPNVPPPGAPSDLDATAGNGQVALSWTAPASNLWYWIYYCDLTHPQSGQNCSNLSTYTRTADPVTTGTSFTLSYLANGDTYEFYVTAINSGGESPPSNTVLARPLPPLPGAPTGLTAKANNNGTITLSWTAPGSGLWYWVYYRDKSDGQTNYTRLADPVTTGTSFTLSYLTVGDTYDFYVTAINLAGEGPASNVAEATSYMPPPPAPTGLTAKVNVDASITLSWTAPAPNLYYYIWWSDETTSTLTQSRYPVSGTTFTIPYGYLIVGHAYDFYVQAVNPGGRSLLSNKATAVPIVPDGAVNASVTSNYYSLAQTLTGPWYQRFDMTIQVTGERTNETNGTTAKITVNFNWNDSYVLPVLARSVPNVDWANFAFGLTDCTTGQTVAHQVLFYRSAYNTTSGSGSVSYIGSASHYYAAWTDGVGAIYLTLRFGTYNVPWKSGFSPHPPPNYGYASLIPLATNTGCPYGF